MALLGEAVPADRLENGVAQEVSYQASSARRVDVAAAAHRPSRGRQ